MTRNARLAVPLIVIWSLLVWASRLRNIYYQREDLTGAELGWRIGLAALFVLVAMWSIRSAWLLWRDGARDWWHCASGAVITLALLNIAIWPVRAYQILMGDWGLGFKVVHTVLALVSVGLGLLVAWVRYGRADHSRSIRHGDSVASSV